MSDWKESPDAPNVQDAPGTQADGNESLSPRGIAAMQGSDATSYQDAQERDLTMRTYQSGDQYFVRVFDGARTPQTPDRPAFGDAGRANLLLERNDNGEVSRARLQDIETMPGYQNSGTGSRMLQECESIAQRNHASEIYGVAPDDSPTRDWYARRGYQYRQDGREVYKYF